jgi:hypothetical protein
MRVVQVVNKGSTTITISDATNPQYEGDDETWSIQLSAVAPATNMLAYVNPADGIGSAQIGSFDGANATVTVNGIPGAISGPLDANGYANFTLTPPYGNWTFAVTYPGDAAWLPSSGNQTEQGATHCTDVGQVLGSGFRVRLRAGFRVRLRVKGEVVGKLRDMLRIRSRLMHRVC